MMLDLTDVILDPELGGGNFAWGRPKETVNDKGRPVFTEELYMAAGNIQPAPGEEREILDDADRLKEVLLIFTPAALSAGNGPEKADRVYRHNRVYRVASAEPWREHAGFTKALAVFERPYDGDDPEDGNGP